MKKVYISMLLHGNMCYDRYTKQVIRADFPKIYGAGIAAMARHPEVTAHIDFSGLTLLSLKHVAPAMLDAMRPLIARGQIVMVGCQYAASHALCADEEADMLGCKVSRQLWEAEFGAKVSTFFPQEQAYHPQQPMIMRQAGYSRIIVMPWYWDRPRTIVGLNGETLNVYPMDPRRCQFGALEAFYDQMNDGDFVMAGGDFEGLCNLDNVVKSIEELAKKGKVIEWMTADRYDKLFFNAATPGEFGDPKLATDFKPGGVPAPTPFGQCGEDQIPSPSYSRWVGDPEDMKWHGYAREALEAVRAASFANVVAQVKKLGELDVPLAESWSTLPDNVWDCHFEHTGEYPETEAKFRSRTGSPTLMSRAWHSALIGLNSDSSGWFPWTPRTLHRSLVLQTSRQLAEEVTERLAHKVAAKLAVPTSATGGAVQYLLAINPGPARTVELSAPTEFPATLADAKGAKIETAALRTKSGWTARAEVALPAYGYRLLTVRAGEPSKPLAWGEGSSVSAFGCAAALADGQLTITNPQGKLTVAPDPFHLSDPSGTAAAEDVKPDWTHAVTRTRTTPFGPELEVFTELAWCVWLRLVLGLRRDRVEATAELQVDMPRRIGPTGYAPEGLQISFRNGESGKIKYDIPYGTIEHPNSERSFIAVQRFALLESAHPFGIVCLGGNQSFCVCGKEGWLATNLGTSTQGRPDTRPECVMKPDGTAEHRITSKGDQFMSAYQHKFAVVWGDSLKLAQTSRALRMPVSVTYVQPGRGVWPTEQSLLAIDATTAHITAFRRDRQGCTLVFNNLTAKAGQFKCEGKTVNLGGWGCAEVEL